VYKSQTHDIILGEVVGLIRADELMGMEELEKDTSVDIFDRSTNNVRKPEVIEKYRTEQNYIGKNEGTHAITFTPPTLEELPCFLLMKRLNMIK